MSTLPETKVNVEVLKSGRWAQEPWLPQLQVVKGDRVRLSISFSHALQEKGKCKIITVIASLKVAEQETLKVPKQVKKKSEKNPAEEDKKAAEG